MNVRFDLPERHAEGGSDCLIAEFFKMKQHQRHTLVIRKLAKRALELLLALGVLEIFGNGRRDGHNLSLIELFRVIGGRQLAEESPAPAITRQMIQARVPRDGLEPARRGRARSKFLESLKGT